MSKVFIYGASDDLIEIEYEGDQHDNEFDVPSEGKVLLITPTEAVEVYLTMATFWTASPTFVRGNPRIAVKPRFVGDDGDMGLEIEFEDSPIRAYLLDHRAHIEGVN